MNTEEKKVAELFGTADSLSAAMSKLLGVSVTMKLTERTIVRTRARRLGTKVFAESEPLTEDDLGPMSFALRNVRVSGYVERVGYDYDRDNETVDHDAYLRCVFSYDMQSGGSNGTEVAPDGHQAVAVLCEGEWSIRLW